MALRSVRRWKVCRLHFVEVNSSTTGHDSCVCAFQPEEVCDLHECPCSQSARMVDNLARFRQQTCAAVERDTLAPELLEVGNCRFNLLGHEAVHVSAGRLALPPGEDQISPKSVFDVVRVASVSVVRSGAFEVMSVDAVDTRLHHCFAAVEGIEIVPKISGGAIGHGKVKSYCPLIR